MAATIAILTLLGINTLILTYLAFSKNKPQRIVIKDAHKDIERTAIMTPHGTYKVEEKRAPVYNDDAAIIKMYEENDF